RLSVIDLAGGHQPISNETGDVWLVFNGEIYNFRDLRAGLQRRGHVFRSQCDSEVIVHAYEDEGLECLRRLDGMFALALWDSRRRQLLLARDRLGKKPLVYAQRPDGLLFASELQALLAGDGVPRDIDLAALVDYLDLQYIPSPRTIFRDVRALQPGHYLVADGSGLRSERYWSLRYQSGGVIDEEQAARAIRRGVESAVKARLISDVPLGAFLSGGIDSSVIVGVMAQQTCRPVETFSIGFPDEQANELPFARQVAEHFGTRHHEFVVEPRMVDVVPKLARHYGQPFADASALPTFFLAQETRRHVTVALSGDGGDEVFAGYYRYQAAMRTAWWDELPQSARIAGKWLASHVPESAGRVPLISRFQALGGASGLAERYGHWAARPGRATWLPLCDSELRIAAMAHGGYADVVQPWLTPEVAASPLNRMLLADTMTYLPDDLLVKVDIAAMAHSLEVRCPFLDHHLVELAAGLPSSLKLRGRSGKYILRRAFADLLPPAATERPKKGFSPPIAGWLRTELAAMIGDLVLHGHFVEQGLFRRLAVEKLIREHQLRQYDHSALLWSLLMLEVWHDAVLGQRKGGGCYA
ncbi:MAG TPA: asparagine synthase (glutamine-hydrolyzing), partial [Chloroflexota bacterium]|nr:asparagine synthase (glutamine-hydrolyzing) [Chloroflexota bacterium]